jgi:hypothetical protein
VDWTGQQKLDRTLTQRAREWPVLHPRLPRLHPNNNHAAAGRSITFVADVSFHRPVWLGNRQLELGTFSASPLVLATTDLINDPRLKHGKTSPYGYGLQHRSLAVKANG